MIQRRLWTPLLALLLLGAWATAAGQEEASATAAPKKAASTADGWALEIAVARLIQSDLFREFQGFFGTEPQAMLHLASRYREVVGLDPLKDLERIRIAGEALPLLQFVAGESDKVFLPFSTITADLRQPGNLEGILLAFPGYTSTKHGGVTVHSVKFEDMPVYCAFLPRPGGSAGGPVTVIVSLNDKDIVAETERLLPAGRADPSPSDKPAPTADGQMLLRLTISQNAWKMIFERVQKEAEEVPAAFGIGVLSLIQSLEVMIVDREGEDPARLRLIVTVCDEDRASQVAQLIRAGVAYYRLAAQEVGSDLTLAGLPTIFKGIECRVDGCNVSAEVPLTDLRALLLPLSGLAF
ncbi:MAG: hypothetical protein ACYTG0_39750 [Planctomycetota bacterium]